MLALVACGSPRPLVSTDAAPGSDATAPTPDAPIAVDASPDAPGPDLDPLVARSQMAPACVDGWCWNDPKPSGTHYGDLAWSSPDNVWIGGGGPMFASILQWNGQTWVAHKPPLPAGYPEYESPNAIATRASNDTWLIYLNVLEHWDGTAWTIIDQSPDSNGFSSLWIDPNGDPWVSGDAKIVRYHNGVAAQTVFIGGLIGSIWGTSTDDIFVTGFEALYHYDGTTVTRVLDGPTLAFCQGVHDDTWISGDGGEIVHWDGSTITDMTPPGFGSQLQTILAAGYATRSDVSWLVKMQDDGQVIIHWDGNQMTTQPVTPVVTPLGDQFCENLGNTQIIDGRWWMICEAGQAGYLNAGVLDAVIPPFEVTGELWGTSIANLYISTGGDVRHFDGTTWSELDEPVAGMVGRGGGASNGADELFGIDTEFVGSLGVYASSLEHYDGTAWSSILATTYKLGDPIRGIFAVYLLGLADEAMLVGGEGGAFHYQSGTLTPITSGTTNDLRGIWGPDADHLTIVGSAGTVLAWDRSNPTVFTPDTSGPATTDDLWHVVHAGTTTWITTQNQDEVFRQVGDGAWQTVLTPVSPIDIAAVSDADVVLSGTDGGSLARWNGSAFVLEYYPHDGLLSHLFGLPDGTMVLGGLEGFVTHAP